MMNRRLTAPFRALRAASPVEREWRKDILRSGVARPLATAVALLFGALSAAAGRWDTKPDTWVAVDALGRTLPTFKDVGPPRPNKTIGIFYFLWLGEHGEQGPFDVSKILAKDPGAINDPANPAWGPVGAPHHWGEPAFGYYLSRDPWVLRKHAQMLPDAGVDTLVFDVTNQFTYPRSYLALCRTFEQVRKEGGATPQIAFLTPFWDPAKVVRTLYRDLYRPGLYRDLWFRWEGKPLILADPDLITGETLGGPDGEAEAAAIRAFFTFRKPQPDYFQGPTGPRQWGWLEVTPQHAFYRDTPGRAEQVTVGVAQNAVDGRLSVLSNPRSHGRSFHDGAEPPPAGQDTTGRNFAEQWNRAIQLDPAFIFITGWNEWIAGRFNKGNEFHGMGPVSFVDEFNAEFSRDVEPANAPHGDNYSSQMAAAIRRYKGVRKPERAGPPKVIRVDGDFRDWAAVRPEFRDDRFDTMHRDHAGWGSAGHYADSTGRNDFVLLKVARDTKSVSFYVRTRAPVSPAAGAEWMVLLLNTDASLRTGWNGFDVVVNRVPPKSNLAAVEAWRNGGWRRITSVPFRVRGSEMELSIPRSALGLKKAVRLDLKWLDNVDPWKDPLNLYRHGDTAPNGRFAYRYEE
jgi:hypothetical protein